MMPSTFSDEERASIAEFLDNLCDEDRKVVMDLLTLASDKRAAIDQKSAMFLRMHAWQISMLLEVHKEIQRLKQMILELR